jgi:hypothetical protein
VLVDPGSTDVVESSDSPSGSDVVVATGGSVGCPDRMVVLGWLGVEPVVVDAGSVVAVVDGRTVDCVLEVASVDVALLSTGELMPGSAVWIRSSAPLRNVAVNPNAIKTTALAPVTAATRR